MGSAKVTRELADFINSEYKLLRRKDISGRRATGIINSFLHNISLSRGAIDMYGNDSFDDARKKSRDYDQRPEVKARKRDHRRDYYQRPEVKAHRKDYFQRPEVKARQRDYQRKMTKPLSGEFKAAIDIFTGFDVKLTARQVWEKYGGQYNEIIKVLNSYHRMDLLNKEMKDSKACYSLNPKSSFICVVDGFFKKKEKEL